MAAPTNQDRNHCGSTDIHVLRFMYKNESKHQVANVTHNCNGHDQVWFGPPALETKRYWNRRHEPKIKAEPL